MSVDDSISSYNPVEMNESIVFVNLLLKYKIILEKPTTCAHRKNQGEARVALTEEFNKECHTNLTNKQIIRKLNNMKMRIKDKKHRNSLRTKQLKYRRWEQQLMDLMDEYDKSLDIADRLDDKIPEEVTPEDNIVKLEPDYNGRTPDEIPYDINIVKLEGDCQDETPDEIPPDDIIMKLEENCKDETPDKVLSDDIIVKLEPDCENKSQDDVPPDDDIIKLEADYKSLDDGQNTSSQTSTHYFAPAFENKPETRFENTEGAEYDNLSLDELKRTVLKCQMNTFKAQEAAARATERLKLYKLSLIQQGVIKS